MLENLFGKKQAVEEPPVEIKKEEIKGDAKNFNNARAMLQQNFGKGGGNTNVMNVHNYASFTITANNEEMVVMNTVYDAVVTETLLEEIITETGISLTTEV